MKPFLTRWLPLLAWMALIYAVSADPNPYRSAVQELGGAPGPARAAPGRVLPALDNEQLGKVSHLGEYVVLGLLALRALRPYGGRVLLRAALLCLGYALLDEIHQHFVPGRAFQLADLGLDLLGSILGAWLGLRLFR